MAYPTVDGVKLFSHTRGKRKYPITKITIHHMAGKLSGDTCWSILDKKSCSCDYMVDKDAKVYRCLDDTYASICSSNYDNDHRAITIETANSQNGDPWPISDAVYERLIQLVVELCKCYDIKQLNFTGDKTGNLTMHKMFTATACPGPYLEGLFPIIAMEVNEKLAVKPLSGEPVRMQMGPASGGDVKRLEMMLQEKQIPYTVTDGLVVTDIPVSGGDQVALVALCADMAIPCVVYEEPAEPEVPVEPETPVEPVEPCDPVVPAGQCELLAALQKENAELKERITELETDKVVLTNRVALRDAEIVDLKAKLDAIDDMADYEVPVNEY